MKLNPMRHQQQKHKAGKKFNKRNRNRKMRKKKHKKLPYNRFYFVKFRIRSIFYFNRVKNQIAKRNIHLKCALFIVLAKKELILKAYLESSGL